MVNGANYLTQHGAGSVMSWVGGSYELLHDRVRIV